MAAHDIQRGTSASGAIFSPCERYRYVLWRRIDGEALHGTCAYIGLNPSTATHEVSDPTVTRCRIRAEALGCSRFVTLNLFAYRATRPKDMLAQADPIGRRNDHHLVEQARRARFVIACWGNHGRHLRRDEDVCQMLWHAGITLWCLDVNKGGEPKHPLYVRHDKELEVFDG